MHNIHKFVNIMHNYALCFAGDALNGRMLVIVQQGCAAMFLLIWCILGIA